MKKYTGYLIYGLISLICIMALIQCDQEGPKFKPTKAVYSYTVSYYYLANRKDIENTYKSMEANDDIDIKGNFRGNGFEFMKNNHCHIFLVNPGNITRSRAEQEDGHANMHCKFGDWHEETRYPDKIDPELPILSVTQAKRVIESLL